MLDLTAVGDLKVSEIIPFMLGGLSLLSTGCGSDGSETTSRVPTSAMGEAPFTAATKEGRPTVTFDMINGGSPIIEVYPGVTTAAADRVHGYAAYNDGDTLPADCKITGRTVHSHPEVGEDRRTSDVWVRLDERPADKPDQYATAVYLKGFEQAAEALPNC